MNHHCTNNNNTNESFIRPLFKPAISPPAPNLMSLLAFVIRCKWSSTCSVVGVVSNTFLLVHVGCFNVQNNNYLPQLKNSNVVFDDMFFKFAI